MIQGTASGVGKTVLTLALCRIFALDGYSVAPFKAQNMTTNTHITQDSDEIATSQWLQALASGARPCADMNPVILKPSFVQKTTSVVLGGKDYGIVSASNYKKINEELLPEIMSAYVRLSASHDIIVIEGAGSPVELNLNTNDIVNMGMARRAKAPVLLVADIDRGGVFASLYGTVSLMTKEEKAYVKALIVNRFKGEPAHFADGVKILEDITKLPVAGVVPYMEINLPEEDSLFGDNITKQHADFETQFDLIAGVARKALNMDIIYKILDEGAKV